MYKESVETLPLNYDVTCIEFKYGEETIEHPTVPDYGYSIDQTISGYLPDYGIRGFYQQIGKDLKHIFHIHEHGLQVLYITGVPKSGDPALTNKFRLSEALFTSYWEDITKGYLFQIINI